MVYTNSSNVAVVTNKNILDECVQIAECEYKMFETVINLDMMEVIGEADLSDQEEDYETGNGAAQASVDTDEPDETKNSKSFMFKESVKGLIKKIKELLEKIWKAVVNAVKTLFEKISALLSTDKALAEKYKVLVDPNYPVDWSTFPGIQNFEHPKEGASYFTVDRGSFNKVISDATDVLNKDSKEAINDMKDNVKDQIKQLTEDAQKKADEIFVKTENFVPSREFIGQALKFVGGKKDILNKIKKEGNDLINEVKKLKDGVKTAKHEAKANANLSKEEKDKVVTALNAEYTCLGFVGSGVSKITQIFINNAKKSVSCYRKAIIAVGMYASKKDRSSAKQEAALIYAIGEESDVFVDYALEY